VKKRPRSCVKIALARDCLTRDGAFLSKSSGRRSSPTDTEDTTSQLSVSTMPLSAIQKIATAQVSSGSIHLQCGVPRSRKTSH
jgi:hypothetical protein